MKENLIFLIDLATIVMVTEDTMPTEEEHRHLMKLGTILILNHEENDNRPYKKS